MYVGRFAPSPTGLLHQGSLACALAAFLDARAHDGVFLVRIEDIDSYRCDPGLIAPILETLKACGIASDGPVLIQSQRLETYRGHLQALLDKGLAYPCSCTASEILARNALNGVPGRRYTGYCRQGLHGPARSVRMRTEDANVAFEDRRLGQVVQNVYADMGDFVLKRADGPFAYQLACVVDDALSGVTDVVRGEDILPSTAAQMALFQAFDRPSPRYLHLPLVLDAQGRKLSKQNKSPAVTEDFLAHLESAFAFYGFPRIGADNLESFYREAVALWGARFP